MNKGNLNYIGMFIAFVGFLMMIFNETFYPPEIKETYQECDSWCIRDNGTSPCNCREMTEEEPTVSLWYFLTIIGLIISGLILMIIGWLNKTD